MKKREIGSEFWNVYPLGKEQSYFEWDMQWYLSGRIALKAIIKDLHNVKTVKIPSWCCDSMIQPFLEAGLEVSYYPVYYDNGVKRDIQSDCDVLLLMDYFGYAGNDDFYDCPIVIRDVTHSIFSKSYKDADYFVGSLRKWCGLWTGGFAWKREGGLLSVGRNDVKGYAALRKRAMQMKHYYICEYENAGEGRTVDKRHLEYFEKAEMLLGRCDIAPAVDRDIALANKLDVKKMKEIRRKNAKILMRELSDFLIFPQLRKDDCPLFVPILVPFGKRDMVRKRLIEQEIYCPVHWPFTLSYRLGDREQRLYTDELSLVCDQRYGEDDMMRIVKAINELL